MSETLVSYAALLLADADKDITSDNLQAVLSAANATVDGVWIHTFAEALKSQDIKENLFKMSANVAPSSGSAPAAAAGGDASAAAAEEEKEEEKEEEESDEDMGMGLFD
ncbi:60S acidic ribosomal protein P1-beta [Brettanomyces nanus]|uniref:60S acidic ribosomal protein P1-beta n=1 Tax=Eeniella nana TaxID=13502 RepID=A0A875S1M1_EENNA|nr:60S acidic ribosomal protein P1-beta [Brettanomyces nanus]QPG73294.1 60S acidic ribosomal protein P1-beta [Brettanomyces nanus]